MPKKPFITANQVTFLRLILLPVGTVCLYASMNVRYFALVFMTLVGCTDFVDGYLARKYGVTKLGSLMDPIADKIFVALVFVPFADLGWMPNWIIMGIFIREFLVTAIRTSHERRGIALKSTYLAKVKTWFQMAGAGVVFLTIAIRKQDPLTLVFASGVGVSVLAFAASIVFKKPRQARGAAIFAASAGALLGASAIGGNRTAAALMGLSALAITWVSGWDYIVSAVKRIGPRLDGSDFVRWLAAVLIPILGLLAVRHANAPVAPIIIVIGFELAVGGLDNLLAHHKVEPSGLAWAIRSFALVVLLAASMNEVRGPLSMQHGFAWGAAGISTIATAMIFWTTRRTYLDEEPARPEEGTAPGEAA